VKRIILLLIVLTAASSGGLWWWARESLPRLDGQLRLAGLTTPVEVLLDPHGVPHVYAEGPEDVWFAAGVMHARDRLWQMELYRRAASGRLSEILGASTLPIDRRFVTLDLRAGAEAEWQAAPAAVRMALMRYAAGVNAYLAQTVGRRLPLEFQILRVTPGEWTPVDSLAIGRLMAYRLGENHQAELVRHALMSAFGAGEALRLGGRYPAAAPTIMQGDRDSASTPIAAHRGAEAPRDTSHAGPRDTSPRSAGADHVSTRSAGLQSRDRGHPPDDRLAWPHGLEWLHPAAKRGNSNNWVIAGRSTASGRPLLANDPHLQVEFPSVWYEMHLVAAGLDVIGVTIPGAPFVVLGHNERIAWGMTNTGADVQDLFVERVDLARRVYFYRGQWQPIHVTAVQIPVRGGGTEAFEVWRTRHGPIVADVGLEWEEVPAWLTPGTERTGERRVFSLAWDLGGEMAGAFEALNRATTWAEFTTAVERFAAPSQNFVYADVEGNIGYAMTGVLPVRSSGVGSLPSDGTTGEGEWTGRIDSRMLPRLFNPEAGYVTSSNNQIDRHWSGLITRDWAQPYRTTRLHELIRSAERADPSKAEAWQNDVHGLAAVAVLAPLESTIAAGTKTGATGAVLDVLQRLHDWDKQIDGRPVVTLFHVFEEALWRRTFFDEMGAPLYDRFYEWASGERPAGLYAIIDDQSSRWFDDIATIDRHESRDDVYLLAAQDAVDRMRRDFGDRPWSDVHAVRFEHPLAGVALPLGWVFSRGPVPIAGGGSTVKRVSYNPRRPFSAWEVPSWRQIFDVGAWDDSRVVLPSGQSGHPFSPHHFDQNEMWRQGQYRQQLFTRARVEAAGEHRLLLVP
jgi:penicillin G amidase